MRRSKLNQRMGKVSKIESELLEKMKVKTKAR
jgi:hypothetical protein